MPNFGRFSAHGVGDDQDHLYSMAAALDTTPLPRWRYWPFIFGSLDQGGTGTCVAHALKHWMMAAPVIQTSPTREPKPYQIYRDLVLIDEWPGNDHEATGEDSGLIFGTSVRAAFKWAQRTGYVGEYRWAANADDLSRFILTQGPVVIGVNWYRGMMLPDDKGFLNITGPLVGGHSVAIVGANDARGDYTIVNSWGPYWGHKGRARIRYADMHRLIFGEDGEAAAGLERKLV